MAHDHAYAPSRLQQYILSSIVSIKRILNPTVTKLVKLMAPDKDTRLGITFGQLYSIIMLLMIIAGGWLSLNSRITALEEGRKTNAENIALIRKENTDAHTALGNDVKDNNKVLNQLLGALNGKVVTLQPELPIK